MISREDMFHNKYRFWRRLAFIYRYGTKKEIDQCEKQLDTIKTVAHKGYMYTELIDSKELDTMNIILFPVFSTIIARIIGKDIYEEIAP